MLKKIGAFMLKMILISLFYRISTVGKRFWHIDKRAFLVRVLCNHVHAVDDVWFLRIIKDIARDFIFKNCLVVWKLLLKELALFFCSGHFVRSHDWGIDRPRNWKWVCSRGCSWSHIRGCFLNWSIRVISCSLAIRWIWDRLCPLLGEQF